MAEEVNIRFDGINRAIQELEVLPGEAHAILTQTVRAVGDRARRAARASLKEDGVTPEGQKRRVQGRGGRAWIGADDINPVHLQGRVEVKDGKVYVDGALVEGARLVRRGVGYILRYADGKIVGAVTVDFRDNAFDALDAAEAVADSDLPAQIFEGIAVRRITGITKRL